MATRYWVGGNGSWTASATANWSTASALSFTASCAGTALTTTGSPALVVGMTVYTQQNQNLGTVVSGSGNSWVVSVGGTVASRTMTAATVGASAPTSSDDTVFDANSNGGNGASFTVTGSSGVCRNITASSLSGNMSLSGTISVYGSWSSPASNFTSSATVTFSSTTTGQTINTNNASISINFTFNGSGGAWTLSGALTCGSIIFTNGTFSTGNYAITAGSITNSGTGTNSVSLGSSTVSAGGWSFGTTTGLTFSAGTSTITGIGGGTTSATFAGGGLTYYNVSLSSCNTFTFSSTLTITGANTYNNLTITGYAGTQVSTVTINANQTVNGTFTTTSASVIQRPWIQSATLGTSVTITAAAVSLANTDFSDITGAGAATWSGTSLGNCAGNSGITFSPKTVYWNLTGGQNWSSTGWATTSGGTPALANFPVAGDTAVFNNTGAASTVTLDVNWNVGTIDLSARTNAMTLGISNHTTYLYNNFLLGSGVTISGNGTWVFYGRNSQGLTSNGASFANTNITVNSLGGTVTLNDALSATLSFILTTTVGTLNTNAKSVSVGNVVFSSGTTVTTGGSTFTLSAPNGSPLSCSTTISGSPNIVYSGTITTSATFAGNGQTYGTFTISNSTGIVTFNGNNTFTSVVNNSTGTNTLSLGSTTQTTAGWSMSANGSNTLTITGNSATSPATINYTGAASQILMNYTSISNVNFQVSGATVTAPYVWQAGANSTNGGGNTGIAFIASYQKAYLLTSGTSFTVPGDWTNAANNIYLIGGGGGGAGSYASGNNRAGGGGGGGGGFTRLTNQTLSGSVSYTIGAGGTAGAAGGNGGTAGSTTWNSGASTAGGGGGGQGTTTPTSTGGAAGTGTTYNGGAGGAGSTSTAASTGEGGGGGGGAGGPNGVGGTGGAGFASTTAANIAGGGGGGNGGGSNGTAGSSALGGNGGNNFAGTGGATGGLTTGAAGTVGGGGAGGASTGTGGAGGAGLDIQNTVGGGGGGGGSASSANSVAVGGGYGGGGGGAGQTIAGVTRAAAAGSQGMIFIIYGVAPAAVPSNYFLLF